MALNVFFWLTAGDALIKVIFTNFNLFEVF